MCCIKLKPVVDAYPKASFECFDTSLGLWRCTSSTDEHYWCRIAFDALEMFSPSIHAPSMLWGQDTCLSVFCPIALPALLLDSIELWPNLSPRRRMLGRIHIRENQPPSLWWIWHLPAPPKAEPRGCQHKNSISHAMSNPLQVINQLCTFPEQIENTVLKKDLFDLSNRWNHHLLGMRIADQARFGRTHWRLPLRSGPNCTAAVMLSPMPNLNSRKGCLGAWKSVGVVFEVSTHRSLIVPCCVPHS